VQLRKRETGRLEREPADPAHAIRNRTRWRGICPALVS
jgi:hypothetical protein